MRAGLFIGPLDNWLTNNGFDWAVTLGNILFAFLLAGIAAGAVGRAAGAIASGRLKKLHADQPKTAQRIETAVSVFASISKYVFYFIALAVSAGELGLASAMNSMLAAAGIGTLALGIGAQSLIGDIVTGLFLLFEDQLAVGDYVLVGDVEGTVEELTLRTVTISGWKGERTIIPNGQVKKVVNYSRHDYLAVVEIDIDRMTDANRAAALLGEEMQRVLDGMGISAPLRSWGVVRADKDSVTIRASVPTTVENQWQIQRETLNGVSRRFSEEGIPQPICRHIIKESDSLGN